MAPMPKRSSQRRRVNKPTIPVTKAPAAATVPVPDPDPDWHPIALRFYESLKSSGQSVFYEPADWMTAWTLCESMSREFSPQSVVVGQGKVEVLTLPPKASALGAWAKIMGDLLVTEGSRRRVRLELERPGEGEVTGDVSELDEFRRRLSGSA